MNYEALRDGTVIPAIRDNGFAVRFTPISSSNGRTITQGDSYTGYAIDLGTSEKWGAGDSSRQGSRKLMVAGVSSVPRAGDRVEAMGLLYRVVGCDVVQPGGVGLYYEVYVK